MRRAWGRMLGESLSDDRSQPQGSALGSLCVAGRHRQRAVGRWAARTLDDDPQEAPRGTRDRSGPIPDHLPRSRDLEYVPDATPPGLTGLALGAPALTSLALACVTLVLPEGPGLAQPSESAGSIWPLAAFATTPTVGLASQARQMLRDEG